MISSGYVIIEGNIGAGKSTFAKALTRALGDVQAVPAEYLPEPDETSNPFLARYYSDPQRWAYTMQMHLLGSRYKATQFAQWGALNGRGWYIMDRSYFGDLCFAQVQRRDGYFTDDEFNSYVQLHKAMQANIHFPTAAIFLRCSTDELQSRIAHRMSEKAGRLCECAISKDYLRNLQIEIDRLEAFMVNHTNVISVDWHEPRNADDIQKTAEEVAEKLVRSTSRAHDFYNPWGACANSLFEGVK